MRGFMFSEGTSEENKAAAEALDPIVLAVVFPDGLPQGVERYADVVGPKRIDGKTWCYPADETCEPILIAAGKGPVLEEDNDDWFTFSLPTP